MHHTSFCESQILDSSSHSLHVRDILKYDSNVINVFIKRLFFNHSFTVVSAEVGGSAGLPCDIDSELADEPVLVRWFRLSNTSDGAPFYILDDAQRRGIWNANHDISVDFAGRAYFSGELANTIVDPVRVAI